MQSYPCDSAEKALDRVRREVVTISTKKTWRLVTWCWLLLLRFCQCKAKVSVETHNGLNNNFGVKVGQSSKVSVERIETCIDDESDHV